MRVEAKKAIEDAPVETRSSVHGLDHLERVWKAAKVLGKKLGADMEILAAAVFLHDLARHRGLEFHGPEGAKMAKPILEKIGFPKQKITAACEAIAAHDYQTPSSKRKSLEAKILFDADKFDTFGGIGIRRITNHALNTGRMTVEQILDMIDKRYNGLAFKESRKIARNDYEKARTHFEKLSKKV